MNNCKTFTCLYFLFAFVMITSCGVRDNNEDYTGRDSLKARISISGAFALYPLVVRWGEEYHKLYPGVSFDVQAGGAGKGLADALSGMVDAGMVSRGISTEEFAKGAWPVAVAKDAVVATICSRNPYIEWINKKGISRAQFKKIWIYGTAKTWGDILGNGSKEKLQIFTRSDAAGAPETWAKYLGGQQEDLRGTGVFGDPGVAESVAQDIFSIGYNNVNYVYEIGSRKPFEGLLAVPIDLNDNGILEEVESFYGDIDALNEAINTNIYPTPPGRELYLVFKGKPGSPAMKKFLKWVLNEGQQYVPSSGYVQLNPDSLKKELDRLK